MQELPAFPEVEVAIMHEAQERLAILQRKKSEMGAKRPAMPMRQITGKRDREDGDVVMAESGTLREGEVNAFKKRKSPSPGLAEAIAHSAFGSGMTDTVIVIISRRYDLHFYTQFIPGRPAQVLPAPKPQPDTPF